MIWIPKIVWNHWYFFFFYYLFYITDFAIECYECTNPPEVSKGDECDSDRLITCPRSYDRCMTMKYTVSRGQSGPVYVEHRSCSNIASCDPKNLLNSKCNNCNECHEAHCQLKAVTLIHLHNRRSIPATPCRASPEFASPCLTFRATPTSPYLTSRYVHSRCPSKVP